MRICLKFSDRVGLGEELLTVFARRRLNVKAIDVDAPNLYIDVPELVPECFDDLRRSILLVDGVSGAYVADMLPSVRRRLYLDTLLTGMPDPILAVDSAGTVLIANAAAAAVVGVGEAALTGIQFGELFNDRALQDELLTAAFRIPLREVSLHGESFLLDVKPLADAEGLGGAPGGIVTLHAPSRMGQRLCALQHGGGRSFDNIIGESAPMRDLKARAVRVAAVDAPLLILGETGTGKELIALACHAASSRAQAPFLALNCAAMPENLAESELFGYAPGAFSGAQRGGKPGLLELADHGTVFLDEIGEMSPYLQAKLLRFLNDGTYRRVGGDREMRVDVRIISATHRDLEQMVEERSFRADLFYRLNVLSLKVPPLRSRGEDILLLARHTIERASAQVRKLPCRLSASAAKALMGASWPGNVRQLQNVIFRAVTMSDSTVLDAADLELAGSCVSPDSVLPTGFDVGTWEEAMGRYEKGLLLALYPHFPSSRKLAAHLRTSHTMIAGKLRKHNIRNG